jgi:hypothetical protein
MQQQLRYQQAALVAKQESPYASMKQFQQPSRESIYVSRQPSHQVPPLTNSSTEIGYHPRSTPANSINNQSQYYSDPRVYRQLPDIPVSQHSLYSRSYGPENQMWIVNPQPKPPRLNGNSGHITYGRSLTPGPANAMQRAESPSPSRTRPVTPASSSYDTSGGMNYTQTMYLPSQQRHNSEFDSRHYYTRERTEANYYQHEPHFGSLPRRHLNNGREPSTNQVSGSAQV